MDREQAIRALRDLLMAANASDSDNPPELGGNDLPPESASEQNGLYGFAMAALVSLGQGPSYAHYVRTGEWVNTEDLSQSDMAKIAMDTPSPRWLVRYPALLAKS